MWHSERACEGSCAKNYGLGQGVWVAPGMRQGTTRSLTPNSYSSKLCGPLGVCVVTLWRSGSFSATLEQIAGKRRYYLRPGALVVNPSAFMRARSVRLYACSADETFHRNRPKFQDALFDALSPILGSADVRQSAAKGIYGGRLPAWWKDLEAEKEQAAVRTSTDGSDTSGKMADITAATVNSDVATPAVSRMMCRYGAECRRKNEDHFKAYAHPGDEDWRTDDAAGNEASEPAAPACKGDVEGAGKAPVPRRICCRYGASCYRDGADHRKDFAHPGDADWVDQGASTNADTNATNEVSGEKSPAPDNAETLPGLRSLLDSVQLSHYQTKAEAWVADVGAAKLNELIENIDDFAESVGLKKLERRRLEKYAATLTE